MSADPACGDVVLTLLEEVAAEVEFANPKCGRGTAVMRLPAKSRLRCATLPQAEADRGNFTLEYRGGNQVAMLAPHGATRIAGIPSEFEPLLLVIGGHVPAGVPPGTYTIDVNQRDESGAFSGSLGIELNVRPSGVQARARRRR